MREAPVPGDRTPQRRSDTFPIVGIGASAGGLEAFTQLLSALPSNTGMAFVLIQHLDPNHASLLSTMLAKATTMPVQDIEPGARPAPDHVYVIPPNADVGLSDGAFSLTSREKGAKPCLPVDSFFRALASERFEHAIGVILSGTGADGTQGLTAIKAEGGLAIVQAPASAKFPGMPESALASGLVDLSLEIPAIAAELTRLSRHPYVVFRGDEDDQEPDGAPPALDGIFALVRKAVGVDLSEYKESSVRRRLARRLALKRVDGVEEYAKILRDNPEETRILFQDILVHVTSFFRDPEIFESLKNRIFPEIMAHKQPGDPIRVWVTGCSTGQEAYSVAIALLEFLGDRRPGHSIQIFGSDVSASAIEKVRAGVYPESVASEIGPDRLRRFFTKVDGGYRIGKAAREICVFVRHDLGSDPPISRIDLITCRNVLIYFNQALQRRVLANFHYSLNVPGFLVLGRREGILGTEHLFSATEPGESIFTRSAATNVVELATVRRPLRHKGDGWAGRAALQADRRRVDVARHVDNLVLARYAPPGVTINDRMEVVQFRGHTGPYLEPPPGQPQLNLLKMARPGLLTDLRIALSKAMRKNLTVRKDLTVSDETSTRTCTMVITPVTGLSSSGERLFTVLFEEAPLLLAGGAISNAKRVVGRRTGTNVSRMAQELTATKTYMEGLISEHQEANEALASANEELVSGNEELQSLNEELETAKEELQATNEELTTLNDELHDRNKELHEVNNDLSNVLSSVEIPMVILDAERRIRRVTPGARTLMNILPTDVGRSVDDIRSNVTIDNFEQLITEVMSTGAVKELEVEDRGGKGYRVQIRPYRTAEQGINGTVVSLIDIDLLRRSIREAEWARDYAAGVVEAVPTPLVVLDADLAVRSANRAFYDLFATSREQTVGRSLQLGGQQLDALHLRQVLSDLAQTDAHQEEVLVETSVSNRGVRKLLLSARPIGSKVRGAMILLSVEDVTDRTDREEQRASMLRAAQQAELSAADANAAKDRFLAVVSHELRTPLSSLLLHVELLRELRHGNPAVARLGEAIERAANSQAQLIDDLLDVSRISSGKLVMDFKDVELATVVRDGIDLVGGMASQKALTLDVKLSDTLPRVFGDPARLRQVVWNLMVNAIKFTPDNGLVSVTADHNDKQVRLQVRDSGIGIDAALLGRLFEPFSQVHEGSARIYGGLGLGLAIVRHVVEHHGGSVRAESGGINQGATFTVTLPVLDADRDGDDAGLKDRRTAWRTAATHPAVTLRDLRVLVVEDDEGTREPLVSMLSRRGAEVRGAASATEAMEVFTGFRPHVLVSDVAMPGEDGYSLIRQIRQLTHTAGGQTPAVALTAFAGAEDRRKALEAGFDVHIAKPIEFKRLATRILELHRSHSGQPEGENRTP